MCLPTATPAAASDQYDEYLMLLPSGITVFLKSPAATRSIVTVGDLLQELTRKTRIAFDSSDGLSPKHRLVFQGRILSDPTQKLQDPPHLDIRPRQSRKGDIIAPHVIELVCVRVLGMLALAYTPLNDPFLFVSWAGILTGRIGSLCQGMGRSHP